MIGRLNLEATAARGDDGVGTADRSEHDCVSHARPFQTGSDHRFAAGFDDSDPTSVGGEEFLSESPPPSEPSLTGGDLVQTRQLRFDVADVQGIPQPRESSRDFWLPDHGVELSTLPHRCCRKLLVGHISIRNIIQSNCWRQLEVC